MPIITFLTHKGYHISVKSITKHQYKNIINELTVVPDILDATSTEIKKAQFTLYTHNDDKEEIIVPRYYGISRFGIPLNTVFNPVSINIQFTKTLREKQQLIMNKALNYIKKHGGGLLSVPCGFGKTVCALYLAYKLGLKTLVVVHKSPLLNQWIDRAKEFLNISDNDIGIIRQNKCIVENKSIVIGMIHTIAKRNYQDIYNKFGFVIYDEAHHVCCKFFSRSLLKTGAKYTLALTATPYRGDGLIRIMYWFNGGTIYQEKMKINKNIIVKMIKYKSTDKLFEPKKRWLKGKVRSDTGRMTTNICNIKDRNNSIVNIINHIRINEPDRKILILSGRCNHLNILKEKTDILINQDINNGLIEEGEINSCFYMGKTKSLDKQFAEEKGDIIFGTYDIANEGLDIKHLNTIILASPKKDIVQSIGRIMRKVLCVGDIRPMIIDIGDDLDAIANWINLRNNIYRKCQYEIQHFYLKNNTFLSNIEYNGMKLTDNDIHHKDYYINNIINQYNQDMNDFIDDIKKYRYICSIYSDPKTLYHNPTIENKIYIVFEDVEPTKLKDILYIDKLTEKDFEINIIKDGSNDKKINLNLDMSLNITYNIMDTTNIPKKIPYSNVPTKRLF
jgi:superfamily II DNA or RNA helicase